ncbi:ABC transporter ATP-binding protein [Salicibibacter cibarius]|uniref:ABC transporter ATP-binding protein n=1 Tax=Salicibibacter cibarius TaxID=2743000 RepID=A0A7T6Z2C9_9BACI|nr:ABC transporter ATP-binding protein [Salicibibacter cibarius]QQK75041.1 ABC transporter ATP-binding protein [Salicibibacter cibarius]
MTSTELKTQTSSPVRMKNLSKIFPTQAGETEHVAVHYIDLEIEAGSMVTLLGPSGCGKTTTLRMVAGFEYPTTGTIEIGNDMVTTTAPNKRDVSMVFQSYALFPHLTVFENVAYGLKIKGMAKKEVQQKVASILDLMHLSKFRDRAPSHLSGGQQQRVALARAVVTEPKVLLFDEPLSNLDAKLRVYMREELRRIQQRLNITSLYVTHDQVEAMAISDKVVIMNNGHIEQAGSPQEIYEDPKNQFVADFIGKADFLEAHVINVSEQVITINLEGYHLDINNRSQEKYAVGDKVHCVARPEYWYVSDHGHVKGMIQKKTYFGSFIEYEVIIKNQTIVFEDYTFKINGVYEVNDVIHLDVKPGTLRVFPYDGNY